MIYPYSLPENIKSEAEKFIFKQLILLKDQYDIFYSKTFLGRVNKERREYEIDFIIAEKPKRNKKCSTIICLEVKGGIIEYNGEKNEWYQNSNILKKSPDKQASSAAHSLIKRYSNLAKEVNIEWALCFPDCDLPYQNNLSTNLDKNKIIDKKSSLYIDHALKNLFQMVKSKSLKTGCHANVYESFKKELLRNVRFVDTLSTRFKYDDKRFVELSNEQIEFFRHISNNKNVLINGYAGTGKTILAISAAEEKIKQDKSVLFLCYNRTLANKVRYKFDKNEKKIKVSTFHSLVKEVIEKKDSNWWAKNYFKSDEFWSITAPIKFDELIGLYEKKFDVIIIDEGQDFKELWFETIFKLSKKDSFKFIFHDKMQNIFDRDGIIPENQHFFKYELKNNFRNTKKITTFLSKTIEKDINSHPKSPDGEKVTKTYFENEQYLTNGLISEIKSLINQHFLSPNQILIMINSPFKDSSIALLKKVGSFDIAYLGKNGFFAKNKIHFTSIKRFKGLETDVLFIVDNHLNESKKTLYTQISRAKNKAYIFSIKN